MSAVSAFAPMFLILLIFTVVGVLQGIRSGKISQIISPIVFALIILLSFAFFLRG